jgi:hypothetical protein
VIAAIEGFERIGKFDTAAIRHNAERFSAGRFRREFKRHVAAAVDEFHGKALAGAGQSQEGRMRNGWLGVEH